MFARRGMVVLILFFVISPALSQNNLPNSTNPTFQSNVRVVVVDVVVTDRDNQPVSGLQKEDFTILEKGKPQSIASFEEHKGEPANQASAPPLTPPYYSNDPLNRPADSVNVLVLDALNTPLGDQMNVRKQMVDYLKTIQPGSRLAIFTLAGKLQIVVGFTSDPALLITALNHNDWGGKPQSSPLLPTQADQNADQELITRMETDNPGNKVPTQAIEAMKHFLHDAESFQTYSRAAMTLQALQQLARYLGGFPGRKNVMWFSGSFPISILPDDGHNYEFNFPEQLKQQLRLTTNMLTSAQVAIYPITAQGLVSGSFYSADTKFTPYMSAMSTATTGSDQDGLQRGDMQRISNEISMNEVAKDTGGEAFYNTNNFKEAFAEAVKNGAHYYTISYSPTNQKMDGGFRPITVKLREEHYKLSYRRGYFAEDQKSLNENQLKSGVDPLRPLMGRGMPSSAQILYKIRVLPTKDQPGPQSPPAGDNRKIKGPVTRYAVDFAILPNDVSLPTGSDGIHQLNVEVSVIAYDHDGDALNWCARSMHAPLKPQLYAAFEKDGIQLHQEIDVPKGEGFLRTGIYDFNTGKAGTLEIPLDESVISQSHATQ
jgi:VWFA-related protein